MFKKRFIALSALVFAGSASAQSSLTIFGVVDAAVSSYAAKSVWNSSFGVPPVGSPSKITVSQSALSNSGYGASKLGFRGTEDLGGGLAASFWLESGISNDDGAKGLNSFNRRSTVSLSGGFGELRLGRDYSTIFWNDNVFDPYAFCGVGSSVISYVNAYLVAVRSATTATNPGIVGYGGSDGYARSGNMVGYFLPANLGGIYGQVQYALPENVRNDTEAGTPSQKGRYVGARLGYANGPFDVAIAYGENTVGDYVGVNSLGLKSGAWAADKIKTTNIGASYNFGVVKLLGELSHVQDERESGPPLSGPTSSSNKVSDVYNGVMIGATAPIGPGLIRLSYSRVKFKGDRASSIATSFATDPTSVVQKIALGYVYNLSRRTALYATVAKTQISNGQNDTSVMGVSPGGSAAYISTAGYVPHSAMGYDFGIRHAF